MRKEDPTIATLLRAQGYATGQFGKNHLGDRDDMLPTNHGFDEFFGNLYHLNAEEEQRIRTTQKAQSSRSSLVHAVSSIVSQMEESRTQAH